MPFPKYAGADWLLQSWQYRKDKTAPPPGPFACKVADIVGQVWRGIYHLPPHVINGTWSENHVAIRIGESLSTYDFKMLTDLVVACHDAAIRMEISIARTRHRSEDGRKYIMAELELTFHPRKREGTMSQRHPSIYRAVLSAREMMSPIAESLAVPDDEPEADQFRSTEECAAIRMVLVQSNLRNAELVRANEELTKTNAEIAVECERLNQLAIEQSRELVKQDKAIKTAKESRDRICRELGIPIRSTPITALPERLINEVRRLRDQIAQKAGFDPPAG